MEELKRITEKIRARRFLRSSAADANVSMGVEAYPEQETTAPHPTEARVELQRVAEHLKQKREAKRASLTDEGLAPPASPHAVAHTHADADARLAAGARLAHVVPMFERRGRVEDLCRLDAANADRLRSVDHMPLEVRVDALVHKEYLLCEYNRDDTAHRSPWSNAYDPPIADAPLPSDRARRIEIQANAAFKAYTDQYFDGGLVSAYVRETPTGVSMCVLIKKDVDECGGQGGSWESVHVVEAEEKSALRRHYDYALSSTVLLRLHDHKARVGALNVESALKRDVRQVLEAVDDVAHLANIGRMVEENENAIRSELVHVHLQKMGAAAASLRSADQPVGRQPLQPTFVNDLQQAVSARFAKGKAAKPDSPNAPTRKAADALG